jgi:hypothetical protein
MSVQQLLKKGNANNIQRSPPSQDAPYHAVKPNALRRRCGEDTKTPPKGDHSDRSCAHRLIDRVGRDDETGCQVAQKN